MTAAEFEPAPIEINPTRRYFSEVYNVGHSYVNMLVAAEEYIKRIGVPMTEQEVDEALRGLPFPRTSEIVDHEISDVFIVMPFAVVAPFIETTKNLRDVREWYEEVMPYVKARTKDRHSEACLSSPGFAFSNHCAQSSMCPLIYTAKHLEEQMFDDDFTQPPYRDDVLLASEVAILKEETAIKYKLRKEAFGRKLIDQYRQRVAKFNDN